MEYPSKELLFIIRTQENSIQKFINQNYERKELFPNLSHQGFELLKDYLIQQQGLCKQIINLSKSLVLFLLNLYQHSKNTLKLNENVYLIHHLLKLFDGIFKHGLKHKTTLLGYKRSYFDMLYDFFTYNAKPTNETDKKIVENIYNKSLTDSSGGLAWFSVGLNDKLLYDRLDILINNNNFISQFHFISSLMKLFSYSRLRLMKN
ncbi:hypothetical protein K502DRAFT_44139 [Neoconidiobolus thromboides FSU 785]|nr:hypothetical protein K502DRAFT_44139 [Neoconidiobolus thromboides FSU 785]